MVEKKKKVAFKTLGCKVNQYESDALSHELEKRGYEICPFNEVCDYYFINTCAVTNEAEKKSRQMVHKALGQNKDAKIIVFGCASQANPEQFDVNNENILVCGNYAKQNILNLLDEYGNHLEDEAKEYEEIYSTFSQKTRAYLKVQEGCNSFCSYCLIPYLRGRSRSRNLNSIVKEAKELSKDNGEIVLVGTDISDYKIDGIPSVPTLVKALSEIPVNFRFGSLEVNVITRDLLEAMKQAKNFLPHFHLSLQSGANHVLKKMNRKYTKEEYFERVELIKEYFPEGSITTDIIVGFPTETNEDFKECKEFVKKVGFLDIHIFKYSSKTGTVAGKWKQLPPEVVDKREKELIEIREEYKKKFLENFLEKEMLVLVEERKKGNYICRAGNFIKVYVDADMKIEIGKFVKVCLKEIYLDGMKGELIKGE